MPWETLSRGRVVVLCIYEAVNYIYANVNKEEDAIHKYTEGHTVYIYNAQGRKALCDTHTHTTYTKISQ